MTDVPDARLLEEFATNGSEEAFAALVQRHIGLVHSVALRHTTNPQHAEDITQAVFVILARKAGSLGCRTVLPGWLYHTARLTAANWQRAEARRIHREQEAFMQSTLEEPTTDTLWQELRPQLDEAMAVLGTGERDALVLRYFQNKDMTEVGRLLGLAENTAQKRVGRALEKLRKYFTKRGVDSTAAGIAERISTHSVQPVSVALAKTVTAAALAKGATASISTSTLIKGALKIMAWAKAKTAVVIGAGILFAAGTTTVAVKEIQEHRTYPWQVPTATFDVLYHTLPQVAIVPSKFKKSGGAIGAGDRVLGIAQPLEVVAQSAYGGDPYRTIVSGSLPQGRYDFIANLPRGAGSGRALQSELRKKFGVIGNMEKRKMNVMLLTLNRSPAEGLKPGTRLRRGKNPGEFYATTEGNGEFKGFNQPIGVLTHYLENRFRIPVVDTTGLTNSYDMALHWDETDQEHPNLAGLKRALLDQLGLELVPTNMPIEMLVVEKAK